MNAQQRSIHVPQGSGGDGPQPVSLETIELIERVLAQMLRSLRGNAIPQVAADAGAIEYESWLRDPPRGTSTP